LNPKLIKVIIDDELPYTDHDAIIFARVSVNRYFALEFKVLLQLAYHLLLHYSNLKNSII